MKYSQEEIQAFRKFMSSGKCDGFICGVCEFCEICDELYSSDEPEVEYEYEFIH